MRMKLYYAIWVCILTAVNILSFTDSDSSDDGLCYQDKPCDSDTTEESRPQGFLQLPKEKAPSKSKWEEELSKISEANRAYQPCSKCSCFLDVIANDLKPWRNDRGITKEDLDNARDRGTKYQILDHKLYVSDDCMFPARCKGVEHFLLEIIDRLPDTEFILNTRDWPQIPASHSALPVFSFSKNKHHLDIIYPAWTFWEGGPAITLYPTGLGRWDLHRTKITKYNEDYPWEKKFNVAFFRGSRTNSERDELILLSRSLPNLVDAKYTKNQAWKSLADTLNEEPAKEVSFEEHCHYKYLFNFRGVAASFRLKHLFLCKSLVFHVGHEWTEFFYPVLKPWVHYIPVPKDFTQDDIKKVLEFVSENDDYAKSIANRGYQFIWDNLTMDTVSCYWRNLLIKYSKLLRFKPVLDGQLKLVEKTSKARSEL